MIDPYSCWSLWLAMNVLAGDDGGIPPVWCRAPHAEVRFYWFFLEAVIHFFYILYCEKEDLVVFFFFLSCGSDRKMEEHVGEMDSVIF